MVAYSKEGIGFIVLLQCYPCNTLKLHSRAEAAGSSSCVAAETESNYSTLEGKRLQSCGA